MSESNQQQHFNKNCPVDCNKWMQGDKNHDYNKWKKSLDIQKGTNLAQVYPYKNNW